MRATLVTLHKYAGLLLGIALSVLGLSGSLLVFDHALDERLAPETVAFEDTGARAPLALVLRNATAAVGGDAEPYRIYLARRSGSPHVVRFPTPAGAPGPVEVSVSPVDADVLAVRTWGEYAMSWVYHLHYGLLAGASGKTVVGVLGLLMLFFCASGVVIWWPRAGRWRRALTIARGRGRFRFMYDLHKTAGIYLLPVLAVVTISGLEIVFPEPFANIVASFASIDDAPAPRSQPAGPAATVDDAVAAGRSVFPDADLKRVHLPRGENDAYELLFRQPGEPWESYAASRVFVDRYSGAVLDARDALEASLGTQILAWQFPLHNGDALGLAGRWLVFVSGLLPTLFFVTGAYMWLRKRRPARSRSEVAVPADA